MLTCLSQNWRGKPLTSHPAIIHLIAATSTKTGLKVRAEIDTAKYSRGLTVSDQQLASINPARDEFHGE